MTRVLIVEHAEAEGPGTLGDFLGRVAAEIRTVQAYKGDPFPDDIGGFDALVSMGGPMNVYEEGTYPFLREETEFLRRVINANIPTLGICLGAQLIAKACYAPVIKAPHKEVGWRSVALTNAGSKDILFEGMPGTMQVFQWHEDTLDIPQGATFLATGWDCENQAFRYGNAFGLQFHVEVTRGMLYQWFERSPELDKILRGFEEIEPDLITVARTLYSNFLWLSDIRKRAWAGRGGSGQQG